MDRVANRCHVQLDGHRAGDEAITTTVNSGTLSLTGSLASTALVLGGGTFSYSNAAANTTQAFTLTVNEAPTIVSPASDTMTVGISAPFTLAVSGWPASYTFSESGALPSGVTLDTAAGVLSGTPATTTGGTYALSFTATNGVNPDGSQDFTLTVNEAPAFTSSPVSASWAIGSGSSLTVEASGFPAPTFSESMTLPSGVSFDTVSGVLSGTPAGGSGGIYALSFTATNGISPDATQSGTLTVLSPPAFTSSAYGSFVNGETKSVTVVVSGSPAPTLATSGTLPTGLSFNTATGVLSGTPADTVQTYALSFTATNGVSPDATQAFTLSLFSSLGSGLTDAYPLHEASGSVRFSYTGSGHDLTETAGTVSQVAGVTGNAASFTANTQTLSYSGSVLPTNPCSISIWFNVQGTPANGSTFLGSASTNFLNYSYGGGPATIASVKMQMNATRSVSAVATVTHPGWHHVVVTLDNGASGSITANIYLDGALINTITNGIWGPGSSFTLGKATGAPGLIGYEELCLIYNRALTAGEVTTLYGAGTPPDVPF